MYVASTLCDREIISQSCTQEAQNSGVVTRVRDNNTCAPNNPALP